MELKITIELEYTYVGDGSKASEEYLTDYVLDNEPLVIWSPDNKQVLYEHLRSVVKSIEIEQ